ncbi:MAG: ECF transporter S component [Oscillospiraceae bacterium]|nr:ECF transporter S component [Oscillospiraceae bacterium]
MKNWKIRRLTRAAIMAALAAIATIAIPVPLPGGGYANAGDIVVLLSAFLLGPALGAASAGLGSCLADIILGYAVYAPGTLVIKAAMAGAAGALYALCCRRMKPLYASVIAGLAGEIIMVLGYFGYESLILQNAAAAAVGMVPNLLQGAVGIAGAALLLPVVRRIADGTKKPGEE